MSTRSCSSTSDHDPVRTVESVGTVDWDDRIGLQAAWGNAEKGWKVEVEWKTTPYGAGLFAKQDIRRGTVLRTGRNGRNLQQFGGVEEMRTFCEQGGTVAGTVAGTGAVSAAVVSYVSDYFYGFDPNHHPLGGEEREEPAASSREQGGGGGATTDTDRTGTEPIWYGIWVPGNGLNHGTAPNTVYRAAADGVARGIDLVALTDITSGDEVRDTSGRFTANNTTTTTHDATSARRACH